MKSQIKTTANKSICKSRAEPCNISYVQTEQWFGRDVQYLALVYNFKNVFSNGHLHRTGQSMNSLPSQILERCAPFPLFRQQN
jgi:microsomal dipeptidase-like Zn-dependent dipeptidase